MPSATGRAPCWLLSALVMLAARTATSQVHVAATGFCAVTASGGSCDEDESGSWELSSKDVCLQRCASCSGCSFISFSAANRDCSWFRECVEKLDLGEDLAGIDGRKYTTDYVKVPGPRRWLEKPPSKNSTFLDGAPVEPNRTVRRLWAQLDATNLRPLLDASALSGCPATYLDLGSNIGNWIHALFSNTSRNGDLTNVLGAYASRSNREEVCAWGFEPNRAHHERLHAIERRLHKRAQRVHFFHAAIASSNGAAAFWSDRAEGANEWGSSLLNYASTMEGKPTATVATVNLTWLLMTHVAAHGTRRVVMKMDVEGAEYTVLPGAVESICRTVDVLLIERHDRFFDPAWHSARKGYASQQMKTRRVRELDDALRRMKRLRSESKCATRVLNMSPNESR